MELPRVGIVHRPYGAADLREICRAAVELCTPVFVFDETTAAGHPDLVAAARRVTEVSVAPRDELPTTVHGLRVQGLITFHDDALDEVDAVSAELGMPGATGRFNPWDKLVQRQRLAATGLSRATAVAVDRPRDLTAAMPAMNGPCVLKPRRGVSGRGIALIDDPDDVNHQLRHRRDWRHLMVETKLRAGRHPSSSPLLADFVSVETVSTADGHLPLAVFDKTPVVIRPRAAEHGADAVHVTGDVFPSRLSEADRTAVTDLAVEALRALHVRHRVTHTEVKLTPAGPEIIEVNGRVGGHLNRLLRLTGGPDLVRAALAAAVGIPPESTPAPPTGWAAGIFPPPPDRDGPVQGRVDAAELRRLPGVTSVHMLAEHGRAPGDTGYRAANLTVHGDTAEELDRRVEHAIEYLTSAHTGVRN